MKKYLFFLIAFCISQFMALNASASYVDCGNSTVTDASGNVYVTGMFTSHYITFGTITLTNTASGVGDMYIVKYDPAGNVLWAKRAGGSQYNDGGTGICTDGSGNVYIIGSFNSSTITFSTQNGTITLTNAKSGSSDMFIVKFDPNGNALWAKSAGGSLIDCGISIVTDGSENVYVTGYFQSPSITFGTTILTNMGALGYDIFIVKYDATSGYVIWAKSAGGSGIDEGLGITIDGSGNVFITGCFTSPSLTFGTTTLTNAGSYDLFIVKYDASGTVIWAQSAGGSDIDQANRIAVDGSGNVYVTGWFGSSSITFGTITLLNAASGWSDMFIVKYDANGNVLWAKSAGGTSHDKGISIATDGFAHVFVTGSFYSPTITFGTTTLTNAKSGLQDIFTVKYNATDGSVLWAKSAGGINQDVGNSLTTDASGNVLVTGYFLSPSIKFGSILLSNTTGSSGDEDMFIAKFDSNGNVPWAKCAGASPAPKLKNEVINDQLNNEISVYPNPTFGKVTLSTSNPQSAITGISVFNMAGKEVFSRKSSVDSPQMEIDLSSQPKGIYVLLIKAGDNYYHKKIIVE